MKLKKLPSTVLAPIGKFYIQHQSTILMTTQIGLSIATPIVVVKESRNILDVIDRAKTFIAEAKSDDEKKNIYKETLKELTPSVVPIVALMATQIFISVQTKKAMDSKDKKISELTDSLAVANNAIASYQAFKREAEERLSEKKLQEVKEAVDKQTLEENPQTDKNTIELKKYPEANTNYRYFDPFGKRYINSTMSPSKWSAEIHNLSMVFTKHDHTGYKNGIRIEYDNEGRGQISYNDIFRLNDPDLCMSPAGDEWGWYDTDCHGDEPDEDLIDVDIRPIKDPQNPDSPVWLIDMMGAPFFRTRY